MKNKTTIIYRFTHSFTGEFLGSFPKPFNRLDAIDGKYSRIYKKFKVFLANENKIDKRFVRAQISYT